MAERLTRKSWNHKIWNTRVKEPSFTLHTKLCVDANERIHLKGVEERTTPPLALLVVSLSSLMSLSNELCWYWIITVYVSASSPAGVEHHIRQLADVRLPHVVVHSVDGEGPEALRHDVLPLHGGVREPDHCAAVLLEF